MESFPPYNEIPQTGSRLNSLLLILIFTLFGSGATLIILKQIDTYHRDQIYLATQAALPEHKISAAGVKKNDTSDWKTYRNEEYGFEFKYRPNWDLKESDNKIFLTSPETHKVFEQNKINCNIVINLGGDADCNPHSADLDISFYIQDMTQSFLVFNKSDVNINGMIWSKFRVDGIGEQWVYQFSNRNNFYAFLIAGKYYEQKLLEILETFKFTK